MDRDIVYSSIQIDDQIQIEMDERTKRLQELNAPNSMQNPYGLAEKYLIDVYSQQNHIDPLEFWKKMREQDHIKPLIRNGLSYLAIPGTTAPIERVFSLSGLATKGIMNCTEEKLLNAKLLIQLIS
uniref:HAT C-terminal dimerisation domain-containing protein n=1 Tax=Meloidogyne incognita TaxID=6306 RepID=A0A914MR61_MELIC